MKPFRVVDKFNQAKSFSTYDEAFNYRKQNGGTIYMQEYSQPFSHN